MRRTAQRVGAQLAVLLILLTSCSVKENRIPYVQLDSGTLTPDGQVHIDDYQRELFVTDHQVLDFCTGPAETLDKGELNFYYGSIYALSNYRGLLLNNGFTTETLEQTSTLLDTTLSNGSERVRLIYQVSGTIRILFENPEGQAHILLGGI